MRKLIALTLALGLSLASPPAQAEKAVDFTLRSTDNQELRLSDLEGQVVLVNFWATWCGPCMVELPHLEALYKELGPQGFTVLAISTDDAKSAARVKPLVKSKGFSFPVLLDKDTRVVTSFNPDKTLPYTVILDRQGNVVWRHAGYTPGDEVEMARVVRETMGLTAASPATPADHGG